MDSLIHADIFFFVTTIAVVVVAIAFTVTLIYLALVLRQVREVMAEVKDEAILVRADIQNFRDQVKQGSSKLKTLVDIVMGIFAVKNKFKKSKSK